DSDNYIPANPLQTPAHIVPEWYFLPFYAILRAMPDIFFIPAKLAGVIAMFGAILLLALAPWLDTSKVRSARFRPLYRPFFWVLVISCLGLGYLGSKEVTPGYTVMGRIFTAYYYLHFLVIMPLFGLIETPRKLPNSISESVLGGGGATAMPVAAAA